MSSPFRPEQSRGDLLGGAFRKARTPDGVFTRHSPADQGDLIGEFPWRAASVEEAIEAARRAALGWARLPLSARGESLRAVQRELRRRGEAFSLLIAREVGKPLWEARAEVEAARVKVELLCEQAPRLLSARPVPEAGGHLRHKPHGVAVVLGQATFPLYLTLSHALPLLLAGNALVIKPSELSPAVGQLLAETLFASGFPRGVVNLIQGGPESGAELAAHAQVDAVFFTGTSAHGQAIKRATLDQPHKFLSLHMGGSCAAIIDADAALSHAVRECVYSAFLTTGQRCNATARIFVHKKIAAAFLDEFAALSKRLRVGYPLDGEIFLGPLRSLAAREQHLSLLASGVQEGAERLFGGEVVERSREGAYLRPSAHLIGRDSGPTRYTQNERFGPDVAIWHIDDLDQGIFLSEQSAYGLALSYFGRKEKNFEEVFHRGRAGLIHWNRGTSAASPILPFGGVKSSGNQRGGGAYSLRAASLPIASLEGDPGACGLTAPGFPGRGA
jgi:succinylglutamic semialdehyde dehydrogenase